MKCFEIKPAWQVVINNLKKEEQASLVFALYQYFMGTDIFDIDIMPSVATIFSILRQDIDLSKTRSRCGAKGGCPKGIVKESMIGNQNASKQNQNKSKTKANLIDNEENTSEFCFSGVEEKEDTDKESNTKKLTEEKEEKNNNIIITKKDEARNALIEKVKSYADKYDRSMLNDFVRYWTEPVNEDDPNSKLKYQLQKTWSTGGRLATWYRNNYNND